MFRLVRRILDPGLEGPVRRFMDDTPHESVLELGCGLGNMSVITDQPYLGIDIVEGYVEYAQEHFAGPNKRFMVGDALDLDPSLGHFDVVALLSFIHHLTDDEVLRILEGISVVSPQYILIVDMAPERAGWLFNHVLGPLDRGGSFRTQAEQRALLEEGGCRVEVEHGYRSRNGFNAHSILLASYAPSAAKRPVPLTPSAARS